MRREWRKGRWDEGGEQNQKEEHQGDGWNSSSTDGVPCCPPGTYLVVHRKHDINETSLCLSPSRRQRGHFNRPSFFVVICVAKRLCSAPHHVCSSIVSSSHGDTASGFSLPNLLSLPSFALRWPLFLELKVPMPLEHDLYPTRRF